MKVRELVSKMAEIYTDDFNIIDGKSGTRELILTEENTHELNAYIGNQVNAETGYPSLDEDKDSDIWFVRESYQVDGVKILVYTTEELIDNRELANLGFGLQ